MLSCIYIYTYIAQNNLNVNFHILMNCVSPCLAAGHLYRDELVVAGEHLALGAILRGLCEVEQAEGFGSRVARL